MTGSVAADGQTPITGQLIAATGISTIPEYSFTGDESAGLFLEDTGVVGLAVGGVGVLVNSVALSVSAASPSAAGTGYAVGDIIYVTGGTVSRNAALTVASLSGSGVASVTVTDGGLYSAAPSNPAAQGSTTGVGSGATFTLTTVSATAITDLVGTSLWTVLGASSFMASLMATIDAATLNGSLRGTALSPTSIGSNQNDYAPTGIGGAALLRLTSSTSVNITGISSTGSLMGRVLTIENIGSNPIILTAQDTASVAANRFNLITPLTLLGTQTVNLSYDTTTAAWFVVSRLTANPVPGNYKNLRIVSNSGTPNSILDVTADFIELQNLSGAVYRASTVSVSPNISTSGAGGLDTGAKANSTWYSCWVIYHPITNTVSSLFSLSATSPTLPSGYTFYVRVGWGRINSSGNFLRISQYGNTIQYVVGTNPAIVPVMASGTSGTYSTTSPTLSSVATTSFVPPTAKTIKVVAKASTVGANVRVIVAPNTAWGGTNNGPDGSNGMVYPIALDTDSVSHANVSMVLESAAVAWASSGTGTAIACLGWEDNF